MSQIESHTNIMTECQEGVLRIAINRPEKKNALTIAMYSALTDSILQAEKDSAVRVILIYGAGDSFTSGNDLKDFLNSPPKDEDSPVFRFMQTISRAQKPIIAAVSGLAVGIGTTMLLHCDLVYAARNAKFILPFVNLGLCPEAGSSILLPLLAGYHRAAELLLLGEPFSAEKAKDIGLVNEICDDPEVLDHATTQACKLAYRPQASVRLTKALLKKANAELIKRTISEESKLLIGRLTSPEAAEAFKAFFERRPPNFERFD